MNTDRPRSSATVGDPEPDGTFESFHYTSDFLGRYVRLSSPGHPMLVRTTTEGAAQCILQEHHAFLSGVLAGAWLPTALDPELVQIVGLHDNPWRPVDRAPSLDPETGWPVDFLDLPTDDKVDFYRRGIDALEAIHPWAAYLVSLHYTTFAGTRDVEALTQPEAERRERLEGRLPDSFVEASARAVEWLKYFDIWSLYVCLAGPRSDASAVPVWLDDPADWAEAPDGTPLEMAWRDETTLALEPWPFRTEQLTLHVEHRRLSEPASSEASLSEAWSEAPVETRPVVLVPRGR